MSEPDILALAEKRAAWGADIGPDDIDKRDRLAFCVSQAADEFKQYCHRCDIPASAANLIADMALVKYNRAGAEGLSIQSYSGATEHYEGYGANLLAALNRYRKVKLL